MPNPWEDPDRTTKRLEGDVIVLSVEEPSPTSFDQEENTGSAVPGGAEGSEGESEAREALGSPMVPSTRLKYSRFRSDKKQDVDDWYCEFELIATANQEEPGAKGWIFQ